jgi:hypothetical protein
MAFKVNYRGVDIYCETADEAVQIATKLGESAGTGALSDPAADSNGSLEVSRYKELIGTMSATQKRFLSLLVDNPHGKTDQAIRQEMGLENNKAIGGMLSVLARGAKKVGISIDMILQSEWKKVNDEQLKEFRIRPEFRKIAMDVGGLR